MRWKYAKLLRNLGNAAQVLFGPDADASWGKRARAEAIECYRVAGIEIVSDAEFRERRRAVGTLESVEGKPHAGGSSWQSLERGSTTVETDYLSGEIVLLGRLHGVPTPVNQVLQGIAGRMARNGEPAGSADPARVEEAVRQLM